MATTNTYNLNLIDFDKTPWHDEEHDNWRIVDAVLSKFVSITNLQGVWDNSLSITAGDRYVDREGGTIWTCNTTHTSNTSGTFAADRAAIPTRWSLFSSIDATFAGTWTASTSYSQNSFVVDSNRYGVTTGTFTSSASYDTDVTNGNIVTLVDLSTDLAAAAASAAAALVSENAAAASEAAIALPSITTDAMIIGDSAGTAWESLSSTNLRAIAGLTSADNKIIQYTGSGTAKVIDYLDEDTMSSDSAEAVASQQSIKAYIDTNAKDLEFVETNAITAATSIRASASVAWTIGYDYIVALEGFAPTDDNEVLWMRFSTDNSVFEAGVADYQWAVVSSGSGTSDVSDAQIDIHGSSLGNDANNTSTVIVELFNPMGTSEQTTAIWRGFIMETSATPALVVVNGGARFIQGTDNIQAIQFLLSLGGTFKAQGDITVWRKKRS